MMSEAEMEIPKKEKKKDKSAVLDQLTFQLKRQRNIIAGIIAVLVIMAIITIMGTSISPDALMTIFASAIGVIGISAKQDAKQDASVDEQQDRELKEHKEMIAHLSTEINMLKGMLKGHD